MWNRPVHFYADFDAIPSVALLRPGPLAFESNVLVARASAAPDSSLVEVSMGHE